MKIEQPGYDCRVGDNLVYLQTIATNIKDIAKELKRIGDILQTFSNNKPELQSIAKVLEENPPS